MPEHVLDEHIQILGVWERGRSRSRNTLSESLEIRLHEWTGRRRRRPHNFLELLMGVCWLVFLPAAPHQCSLDLGWSPLGGLVASTFPSGPRRKIPRQP